MRRRRSKTERCQANRSPSVFLRPLRQLRVEKRPPSAMGGAPGGEGREAQLSIASALSHCPLTTALRTCPSGRGSRRFGGRKRLLRGDVRLCLSTPYRPAAAAPSSASGAGFLSPRSRVPPASTLCRCRQVRARRPILWRRTAQVGPGDRNNPLFTRLRLLHAKPRNKGHSLWPVPCSLSPHEHPMLAPQFRHL